MTSIYDRKMAMDQRETDEDPLYALFMRPEQMNTVIERVTDAVRLKVRLKERFLNILTYVNDTTNRIPKLAFILYTLWLFPELYPELEASQPRRSEPFMKYLERACLEMLQGRSTNLQAWVGNTITDYIVTPRTSNRQETTPIQSLQPQ